MAPARLQSPEAVAKREEARVAVVKVAATPVAAEVADVLDSPEVAELIGQIETLRWTGRKGYGTRALIGACLVKALYAIPTWTRTAALIADHAALRDALGDAPSQWACYRFTVKLREQKPLLDACLSQVIAALRERVPEMGTDVAIDASDLPAYGNGQRFLTKGGPERERFSDPDASWGHRSAVSTRSAGGFYGFKLHLATCARTDLPLAWEIRTAKTAESTVAKSLLAALTERDFAPESVALDKGYDHAMVYESVQALGGTAIIPLRKTPDVKQGKQNAPVCEHGEWVFAGADFKNKRTKWRCPTGECDPASVWRKASRLHPLIPRHTKRWTELYAGRSSVERTFGRLKYGYGLAPLRTRGIERVQVHADLCILAQLAQALSRARAVPLAA
jgi:hypothetical protein